MFELAVTIVDRPVIKTAGLKVRTTMANAMKDCPDLWRNTFGPRMDSFPADPALAGQSYGVSVMVDDTTFDYWAVMPIADASPVPEGMDRLTLPGGQYAECRLPSLERLGDAYTHIYGPWIAAQEKYAINMQGASYELYTMDFMTTGELVIYCPLVEK